MPEINAEISNNIDLVKNSDFLTNNVTREDASDFLIVARLQESLLSKIHTSPSQTELGGVEAFIDIDSFPGYERVTSLIVKEYGSMKNFYADMSNQTQY